MDLVAIEEIKRLKHRYFRFVDTKDWAGVAGCFVPEATAAYICTSTYSVCGAGVGAPVGAA